MRYAIVIEKAPSNYAAYVPDLPGCIATGTTVAETESLIREAIEFHLDGLKAGWRSPGARARKASSASALRIASVTRCPDGNRHSNRPSKMSSNFDIRLPVSAGSTRMA